MSVDSGQYDEQYYREYRTGDSITPYEPSEHWLRFFGGVADGIVRQLHPESVLDVGCAMGFLVEALIDRGVDARGFDISDHAVAVARDRIGDRVWQASTLTPIEGSYDLVTCIEVIEHLPRADAGKTIANMAAATDTILLSTTPDDFGEPTHLNVQPPEYWARLFADVGFVRDLSVDVGFLTPHAAVFRRAGSISIGEVVHAYEQDRWRLVSERDDLRREIVSARPIPTPAVTPDDLDVTPPEVDSEIVDLRRRLRLAIDAAHAADAARASLEATARHREYSLHMAEGRLHETEHLLAEIFALAPTPSEALAAFETMRRDAEIASSRTFRVVWRLLRPYRRLRELLR